MSEKLLDGQQLYTDLLETNPPMTVWLHMPAAALGRVLRVSADSLQILLTFLFLITCLGLSWRVLNVAGFRRLASAFFLAGAIALTLPWLATISEREHWAMAALMPIMAVEIIRCARRNASAHQRVLAGTLAGLAVAIKPAFTLCLVAPALYTVWRTRSIKSLFRREYWIAAGVNLIYLASVDWGYPTYRTNMLPGLLDTYFRIRAPLQSLVSIDLILCLLSVAAFLVARGKRMLGSPVEMITLLTGLGFLLAYVMQGKGFLNHATPICSLILMAVLLSAILKRSRLRAIRPLSAQKTAAVASIVLVGGFLVLELRTATNPTLYPSLGFVESIRSLSPNPRILTVSGDLGVGHPLAREVRGRWVGVNGHQWLAASAALISQRPGVDAMTRARMRSWIRLDLDRLTQDVINNKPDVIIFDDNLFGEGALFRLAPKLSIALSGYERAGQNGSLRLLIRRQD